MSKGHLPVIERAKKYLEENGIELTDVEPHWFIPQLNGASFKQNSVQIFDTDQMKSVRVMKLLHDYIFGSMPTKHKSNRNKKDFVGCSWRCVNPYHIYPRGQAPTPQQTVIPPVPDTVPVPVPVSVPDQELVGMITDYIGANGLNKEAIHNHFSEVYTDEEITTALVKVLST